MPSGLPPWTFQCALNLPLNCQLAGLVVARVRIRVMVKPLPYQRRHGTLKGHFVNKGAAFKFKDARDAAPCSAGY